MALDKSFINEVLRMAQREGEARRREKKALQNVTENQSRLDRDNSIWDVRQERDHLKQLESMQQTGRENLERMQQTGALNVAKVNADAATRTKANAGAFTPNQLADLRRNSLNDAREEILGMADANGNIPNPMYLNKDGKPVAGQPQFLDQSGVQEMINRRSEELYGGYTAGLMDQAQGQQSAQNQVPGNVPAPQEEQLRGFTGLNAGNDEYQKNIIRSMVNAEGQAGGSFKKFTMNGAPAPTLPPPAAVSNPVNIQEPPSGGIAQKTNEIVTADKAAQTAVQPVPQSLYSRFMKPAMQGIKTQVGNLRDVMSYHGDSVPESVTKKKKPFTIPTTALTNQEIMARRGNKPIDRAFNLYSR